MTVCPVALAVGCNRCPLVKMCPLKAVLGDYEQEDPAQEEAGAQEQADAGTQEQVAEEE